MSVDLEKLMMLDNVDIARRYTSGKWLGAVALRVGLLRGLGLLVGYRPIGGNCYHCEVWGNLSGKLSKQVQKSAQWRVPVEGVDLF
jgi:hypothetical protein